MQITKEKILLLNSGLGHIALLIGHDHYAQGLFMWVNSTKLPSDQHMKTSSFTFMMHIKKNFDFDFNLKAICNLFKVTCAFG